MLPVIYEPEELKQILIDSNIDIDTGINECKQFMALHGWTIRKRKKIINEDKIVSYKRVIRRVKNFTGIEIHLMKDDKIIASLMENERDALLVCILKIIGDKLN